MHIQLSKKFFRRHKGHREDKARPYSTDSKVESIDSRADYIDSGAYSTDSKVEPIDSRADYIDSGAYSTDSKVDCIDSRVESIYRLRS
jgi:hypothetical protein